MSNLKEQLEKYKKKAEKKEYLADYNSGFYDGFDSALNLLLPLVEALEYYGNKNNWDDRTSGHGESSTDVIRGDGGWGDCAGVKARQALQELREKLK